MELEHYLHVVFAVTFLRQATGYGYGYDEHRVCLATPKLNYLGDYTNVWKTVRLCHRVADSKSIMDEDGRLYISYTVPIGKGEDFDSLCQCMRDFLMQGEWTYGAKSICHSECDKLNFLIIGSPQPEFIGQKPVYKDKKPIDSLIEVFQIYGNAQVWGDNCFGKPGVNHEGFKRVLLTCKYSGPNLPHPGDLCEYMFSYVNGGDGNILNGTANYFCSVHENKFYLDVVAKWK